MVLLLAGCTTGSGTRIEASQISQFKVGITTYDQVVQALGPPVSTVQNSDGTKAIVYANTNAKIRGATFIPVVGLFAGGADVKSQSVVFTFNADGTLKNYSTSDTQVCSNNGLMANASAANCQRP